MQSSLQKSKPGYKTVKSSYGSYEEIPESWQLKPLSEIGKIVGGGTPDTTISRYWNGDIAWTVPTDITNLNDRFIERTERYLSKEGLQNSSAKLLPVGTVLITSRATIGECAISKIPITTNQGFQSLICNSDNNNIFIYYVLKFYKPKLLRLAYGSTFLEISSRNIKKVSLPCPPLKEQIAIASILSKVDELIQKKDQVIEQTQRLQKDLRQKLLTRGIGHTKFKLVDWYHRKKIEIPIEWEVFSIDKICKTSSGGTPLRGNLEFYKGKIPWIKTGELNNHYLDKTEEFISEEALSSSSAKKYPPNTVLFAMYGATIGKTSITTIEATTNQACCAFLPIQNNSINPYFLQQYLIYSRPLIVSLGEGAGQPNTSQDFMRAFKITYPSYSEQKQIATVLFKIDSLIQVYQNYRFKVYDLKKGLMQKLLTGKIRVKV